LRNSPALGAARADARFVGDEASRVGGSAANAAARAQPSRRLALTAIGVAVGRAKAWANF